MVMKFVPFVLMAVLAGSLTACREKSAAPASAGTGSTNATENPFYLVHGVVKKVDLEGKTVTIQHEEIPKFMVAMTMPFNVKQTNLLEGLEPGDAVWFVLVVAPDESWIEKIVKEKKEGALAPPTNTAPQREAFRVVRDVEPIKEGDQMPNYRFTNELGKTVDLASFKGQALAFTFIFTRCPLPDFCPRMSRNFFEISQSLSKLTGGPTNWHLLSISFDPHYDTPAVLHAYARVFQYDPKRWNFVTGAMEDIDAITDQFNLVIMKRGEEWDHKVRTVVVDAAGRVQKIVYGNEWKPETIVQEIVKAAAVKPSAGE